MLVIIIINTQSYNVLVWQIIMRVYLRTYVVIGSNNNCDQVETYIGVMYKYKLTMYTLIYTYSQVNCLVFISVRNLSCMCIYTVATELS